MKIISILLLAALLTSASTRAPADEAGRLTLDEARQYMLQLINKDRARNNLGAVELDETATAAGQKFAEEMAQNVYLSHVNLAGEKPDVRYTKAGGVDSVGENAYFWWSSSTGKAPVALPLQTPEQTFARSDLEAIEASYIGEVAPFDGHKKQILNPYHTHVGIGLARATDGKSTCLTNTHEFVDRYLTLDAIPQTASIDDKIKISGKVPEGKSLDTIAEGRTTIAVAHRLSTIAGSDTIYVMDGGKIAEQGTHAQLLERDGLYARLWRLQSESGDESENEEDARVLALV